MAFTTSITWVLLWQQTRAFQRTDHLYIAYDSCFEINENLDEGTGKAPKTWQKNVRIEHSSLETKKIHRKSSQTLKK